MKPKTALVVGVATICAAAAAWILTPSGTSRQPTTATSRSLAISTIAGATCSPARAKAIAVQPFAVAADSKGGFFVADGGHAAICHVDRDGAVTTIAGNGSMGYLGDGGPANATELYYPAALAVAADGSLYIADRWNHRVRRVDPFTRQIETIAGNGTSGRAGDGGPAAGAQLSFPSGVALDGSRLFVADSQNHTVRVVDLFTGTISTFAGSGRQGYGGDGGPAPAAQLSFPTSVAVDDAGGVYIADAHNNRVRYVKAGTISTVAGTGRAGYGGDGRAATASELSSPMGVAWAGGVVFVSDSANHRVRRIDASGVISTLTGDGTASFSGDGGPAAAAAVNFPLGVAVSPTGEVLIADTRNARVRVVTPDGLIRTVAGNGTVGSSGDGGPARAAELNEPIAVAATPSGEVLVTDSLSHTIRRIDVNGTITTLAGMPDLYGFSGDGGPATAARLTFPTGVASAPDGSVYVADQGNHRVRRIGTDGVITTAAGSGTAGFGGDGGPAASAELRSPSSVVVAGDGTLFFSDTQNNRVRRVDPKGVITTVAGSGDAWWSGDGGPAVQAGLRGPTGLALGPHGALYIADTDNQLVRVVDLRTGVISTVAGDGSVGMSPNGTPARQSALNHPTGLAIDRDGELFIADKGNCVVRLVQASGPQVGTMLTVAGFPPAGGVTPVCGFVGEGTSPASDGTMLYNPTAVAVETDGSILVADSLTNRVRRFFRP